MLMPPEVFLQAAMAASGDVCLPWIVVAGVPGALATALVFQTRRIVRLTERQEARYDELLELWKAERTAASK